MIDIDFVNRKPELEEIITDITSKRRSNRVRFLAGKSGIGKSYFTEKLIFDLQGYKTKLPIQYAIKIKVLEGINDLEEEGFIVKSIAKEIDTLSGSKPFLS